MARPCSREPCGHAAAAGCMAACLAVCAAASMVSFAAIATMAHAAAAGSGPAMARAAPARPNVLLMLCDDLRPWMPFYGDTMGIEAPNLAKLASEGMAFNNSYCQAAVCSPTRNSFSELWPHGLQVQSHH
eukprot:COSAG01_NODE_4302_length_5160_cov_16.365936_1_plen_130_part_00